MQAVGAFGGATTVAFGATTATVCGAAGFDDADLSSAAVAVPARDRLTRVAAAAAQSLFVSMFMFDSLPFVRRISRFATHVEYNPRSVVCVKCKLEVFESRVVT